MQRKDSTESDGGRSDEVLPHESREHSNTRSRSVGVGKGGDILRASLKSLNNKLERPDESLI